MKSQFFSSLLPELSIRATRATIGMLGFSNPALRAHLNEVFSRPYGKTGSFLGDPVFEATFGWSPADRTLASLAPDLLPQSLLEAMENPPGGKDSEYRFASSQTPYRHQLEAWEILGRAEPQSLVVTSGTGSGKTECFMVPILSKLVREHEQSQHKLEGVRALFLYPLNALIQSQRERLHAWTARFDDGIRFCLYNGNTDEKAPKHERDTAPNQVIDRETLRASPSPILVTNATMLEYMLVRSVDAPILQASQGKLEWIVLDEAHSYIGSQAAELALLLRRVLHGFGVAPENVRFVATSATIGDDEAKEKLKTFLAELAGVSESHVHVVQGFRQIPDLDTGDDCYRDASLTTLEAIPVDDGTLRYAALCANRRALAIREAFLPSCNGKPANTLSEITQLLIESDNYRQPAAQLETLRWLDLLTSAVKHQGKTATPYLPLRLHAFHTVVPGLWACSDPICSHKENTALNSPEWPYGKVFFEERQHCDCGSPVYELRSCNDCNTTYLWARQDGVGGKYYLVQDRQEDADEFALEIETSTDSEEEEIPEILPSEIRSRNTVLIANAYPTKTGIVQLDRKTRELDEPDCENPLQLRVRDRLANDIGRMECPECGGHHENDQQQFRRAMLGAPFMLGQIIPTLLEYCPDIDPKIAKSLERPMRGRRMITFTDSRQGTARMAAKLQQDAERNRLRGLVYFRAVTTPVDAPIDVAKLQTEIDQLRSCNSPVLSDQIKDKEAALSAAQQPKPVPFKEMRSWLETNEEDIKHWIHDYYADRDPNAFAGSNGLENLGKLLLTREFARRPARANSLETLGMIAVHYPKLEKINQAPASLSPIEWRQFLKITLDFHVRQMTAIDLPTEWERWGGDKRLVRKWLLPWNSSEQTTSRNKKWPQCSGGARRNRLARILAYALKIDPTTPMGRDRVDALLRQAWDDLVNAGLLQGSNSGRYLSLEDMAFAPIAKAWMCPVTRRLLDTTFRGVTPYLPPENPTEKTALCRELTVPVCPLLNKDYAEPEKRMPKLRGWLADNKDITILRNEGLWSNLNDRIVESGIYFRTAEHSAQQGSETLARYERDFKEGRINLLSCSTTMEMGVDIGGLSVVSMNNVPPHPANYLQRAGRAGRRGETRSVAVTVCKNNPHDQHVFNNTPWPFVTKLPAPVILLSSPVLVQRHINAMLLSHFLHEHPSAARNLTTLNTEWWFLPQNTSPAELFIVWLDQFDENQMPKLAKGLRRLLRHTCYEETQALSDLARHALEMHEAYRKKWAQEYIAIENQLKPFDTPTKQKEPAYRALEIQKKRLLGEYLLRELANAGFLPGYGFPTDITSFETLTKDEIERQKSRRGKGTQEREDNRGRRRSLPSRDTMTALREYAPGAEVVIDGQVYMSRGITLNWHAPAAIPDIQEIQNIRHAWRCGQNGCGASGTANQAENLSHCPECDNSLLGSGTHFIHYLDPAGFSVDLYDKPHNDVSSPTFVPVERPWIHAGAADWMPLSNAGLGKFRTTPTGSVFYHSKGLHGTGYAICLECGRAEPMPIHESDGEVQVETNSHLPEIFQSPHIRLRGAQGGETSKCEGSFKSYAIKPSLQLGHEIQTDVLEVVLFGLDEQPISDKQVAYSLAVALREGIARRLGVEASELGCDTKPVRVNGQIARALVVYDRFAAGYCSAIAKNLIEALRLIPDILKCPADCDSACQHCLLQHDRRMVLLLVPKGPE